MNICQFPGRSRLSTYEKVLTISFLLSLNNENTGIYIFETAEIASTFENAHVTSEMPLRVHKIFFLKTINPFGCVI